MMKNGYEQMIDVVNEKIEEVERKIYIAESELALVKACIKVYKVADKNPDTYCDTLVYDIFGCNGSTNNIANMEININNLKSRKDELLNFKDYINNVAATE